MRGFSVLLQDHIMLTATALSLIQVLFCISPTPTFLWTEHQSFCLNNSNDIPMRHIGFREKKRIQSIFIQIV